MEETQTKKKRRLLTTAIRWIVVAGLLGLVIRVLVINLPDLDRQAVVLQPGWLATSCILLCLYYFILAGCWHGITVANQTALPAADGILAYFYSLLGKYIPGRVGLILGRLYLYKRGARQVKDVVVSLMLETTLQILSGALVILITMASAPGPMHRYRAAVWALVAVMALASSPRVIQVILNRITRWLRRDPVKVSMRSWQSSGILLLYVVDCFILGAAFFAFVRGIAPVESAHFLYLNGAILLAGLAGVLSLFAPGGLGVREGVLLLLLQAIMPTGLAVVIVLATRCWTTVIELAAFLASLLFDVIRKSRSPTSAGNAHG